MKSIVTLTLNPTVDKSTSVDKIVPEHKLRCATPKFEPGGGGINVSRALRRLGSDTLAVFPAGGPIGSLLQHLLTEEGIAQHPIETAGWTRENFIVVDTSSNQQYRFGMPGRELSAAEQLRILDALRSIAPRPEFLIISGSLPPGVEPDFLVAIVQAANQAGVKVVVDTSGPALQRLVEAGGVYLIKPNLGELSRLVGASELDSACVAEAARELIGDNKCTLVAASMGPQGACLISQDLVDHVPAPAVKKRSTVGAGDSMVAGMVHALSAGLPLREVIRLGVACGTAATMNPGTELFHKKDVDKLYQWLLQTMPREKAFS
ncbi:1-phosphofructokinase [Hymenobacter roseosalivarius DSM 11622]|uniref:1-phosphofructokinase n=1 Tax=Hymenobacter roseosalivarius DSM 11622 TaxID=645990 RepID=A0A1W1V4R3_9BACT|nr:1-phosphofructokinase family hexose kinase [Hymenobacter roseosalivarius]SMB87964.1 1-phosphofructokinase [Hymenobacter roseosalivarius DSM 11622]